MPITRPASSAIGNDRNPATSAAAVAAISRLVRTCGCRVTIGTMRIAAKPAKAQPSAQFSVATTSGDQPSDAAARSFSATAEVPRPNFV